MKKFLYLVQAASSRMPDLLPLRQRASADYLFLTFDKPVEGATFLEGCSWGRGRNVLDAQAREMPGYEYYIFMDDDVEFAKGNFDRFEELLLRYRPAFACPVFVPKTLFTVLGIGKGLLSPPFRCVQVQPLLRGDCQFTALHKTVFEDGILSPFQEQLDPLSWWCTSSTFMTLAISLYGRHALQFNPVAVLNTAHRAYNRRAYVEDHELWLKTQFSNPSRYTDKYILNPFSRDGWRRLLKSLKAPLPGKGRLFLEWLRLIPGILSYRPMESYGFTPEKLSLVLKPDSDIYRQYLRLSPRAKHIKAQYSRLIAKPV